MKSILKMSGQNAGAESAGNHAPADSASTAAASPESPLSRNGVLVIDNYDSFVYNLVQYLGELGETVKVVRNDEVTVDEVAALNPEAVLLSPGPCTPNEAGIGLELVRRLHKTMPIFGVCLGHQTIAQALGADVVRAEAVVHGKVSAIHHDGMGIYKDLPTPLTATRYHSLLVDPGSVPADLTVSARTEDGLIMGLRHSSLPIEGVQYHPESILTQYGHEMLSGFLKMARQHRY